MVSTVEKVRGEKKIIPKMMQHLEENGIRNAKEVYIFDAAAGDDLINSVRTALKDNFDLENIPIAPVGPVIGTHIGPGLTGVLMFK